MAQRGNDSKRLKLFIPPVALPEIVFHLLWHRRSETNPAQVWFRDFIVRHAAAHSTTPCCLAGTSGVAPE